MKNNESINSNSSINTAISLNINPEEIRKHLAFLGYKKGNTVYLRAFLPSSHPDKTKDKGRKALVKNINDLVKNVTDWQAHKRGVYIVVNGHGHTDEEVLDCRTIFYEHDNLDKELQVNLWQSLGLPTPTFQVDTGGKSIHSYWVFKEPIPVEDWRKLQTDLLEYADADRSLKNPSRVMRLAGCVHSETGNQSKIISEDGSTYSYSELRNIIPTKAKSETPTLTLSDLKLSGDVPLYQCLTKDDRSLIDCGHVSPGRNTAGAKLSRNLIGTAARLQHLGHRYEGQPRTLFDDFCLRCSPPLDTREADLIWRSAEKDNPTPSLTDDALENCVKAWHRQNTKNNEPIKTAPETKTSPALPLGDSTQEMSKILNELIDQDLPKSVLEIRLPEVAVNCGRATGDIRRAYEALLKERLQKDERLELGQQIPEILKAQQSRLKPKELFWGDGGRFAHLLTTVAASMPTSVENLITTLIPVAGSRIGTSARIVINPTAKYTQPAIFWSCVVAPTGRLKTPAQEVIIAPLCKLEADEFRNWKLAQEDFEKELKSYKKNSDYDPPEPPSPRKRFLVQSATAETRIKVHSENPRGLLNYRDEWSSFINGRNKYRNGKGDDLELDLSEFNGGAILKDNSNESFFIEQSAISRTGNTQPETLNKFLAAQDFEDYTGEFARWLFCLVPGDVAYIDLFKDKDNSGQLLEETLIGLYKSLSRLPEKDYFLTDGAKGVFQTYHRWLTDAEVAETHPGLRAAYPKIKSYFARLGLWLHIVNAVLAGEEPEQMISGSTMYAACVFTNFYLNQAKLLYTTNSPVTGELLKIKEFIEKRDGVTARDVKYGIFSLRRTPVSEVLSNCITLKNLGLVLFDGKKFLPLKNSQNIITSSETLAVQGVEGDDLGSSKIILRSLQEPETNAQQVVEGDDQLIITFSEVIQDTQINFKTNEPEVIHDTLKISGTNELKEKSDDLDDVLMIKDHHLQNHVQQVFQDFDDDDDQFLEKQKIQNLSPEAEIQPQQAIEQLSTDKVDRDEETLLNNRRNFSRKGQKIEVGGIYLARSLKQQVKVTKTYKNKKADVLIKGDTASEPRLLWSDLYPLPVQPWTPDTGKLADYGGEWVEIVGFTSGGKKFQVELASGKTLYVSKDKLKCPEL